MTKAVDVKLGYLSTHLLHFSGLGGCSSPLSPPLDTPLTRRIVHSRLYSGRASTQLLPFGLRLAPQIFNAVGDALNWFLQQSGVPLVFHYLDDLQLDHYAGHSFSSHHCCSSRHRGLGYPDPGPLAQRCIPSPYPKRAPGSTDHSPSQGRQLSTSSFQELTHQTCHPVRCMLRVNSIVQ